MDIKRVGSQPSTKGPEDWFTGTVRIDPLFQPNESARAAGTAYGDLLERLMDLGLKYRAQWRASYG